MVKEVTAKLYNPEVKEQFLSQYSDKTYDQYRYALCRAFSTEDFLGRDLYTFTTDEIKSVLVDAKHTTKNSIRHTFNVFNNYLNWAAERGYSFSNINIMSVIKDEKLDEFLKQDKIYFSEEEIMNIIDGKGEYQGIGLNNYQDIVVILAIFEGISGNGLTELLNLTLHDIKENLISIRDDKYGERSIKVSSELIRYMYLANEQVTYENKNGTSSGRNSISNLVMNDFIVKTVDRRTNKKFERADKHTIYRRIAMVSDLYGIHNFNAKNIEKSGMIKLAKDLFERDGKLGNEQLAEIAKHFGVRSVEVNGYTTYNYTLLRDVINAKNIEELYDIKINE